MKKWLCMLSAVVFGLTFLGWDAEIEREKNDVSISVESGNVTDNQMLDAKEVYSDIKDVPEFYSDDPELYLEIGVQEMYCEGSAEIGDEILALFGEISSWEEIPYDMEWMNGVYSPRSFQFQCDELKGDAFYIDVWRYGDDHTCVSVNNYAAFLAPAELYTAVENVLREHEDQWEIIPVSE